MESFLYFLSYRALAILVTLKDVCVQLIKTWLLTIAPWLEERGNFKTICLTQLSRPYMDCNLDLLSANAQPPKSF